MLGAITGDIVGSVFESGQHRKLAQTHFLLFQPFCHYTDDTVMTVAIAEAIMQYQDAFPTKVDRNILKGFCKEAMVKWGRKYPHAGYGGHFHKWLKERDPQPYYSLGNGSAMRVSPVAFLYDSVDDVLAAAIATALPSHNHPLGIKGARAIAYCIWAAKNKVPKETIREEVQKRFGYQLDFTLEQIRPVYKVDVTCEGSVPQAITAYLESESYEDCIRKAISIGGDTDTIACMAGGIAEAEYDLPLGIVNETMDRLPLEMRFLLDQMYNRKYGLKNWNEEPTDAVPNQS